MEGVTGGWSKLHNEELNNLHFFTKVIRAIKKKNLRWVKHATHRKEKEEVLVGKPA